jgi:uroporphyrinogen III methyltransferase / synthase
MVNEGASLQGRTVMITRARSQAAEFAEELERYGARVVVCPTIEIVEPESYELLDEAIENLYGYDWLIFTSVNAVNFFVRRLLSVGRTTDELDEIKVCALGEATSVRLAVSHVHVDVVPEKFQAEGVFAALVNYLDGSENLSNLNFLIPRAASGRDFLPRALEQHGARVDVVPAYRTVRPTSTDRARVEALLVGGGIDCITFTSSSAVTNLAQLFDTHDLRLFLKGVRIACIGDVTAETALEYGLETDIKPPESTTPSLAREIAEFYQVIESPS